MKLLKRTLPLILAFIVTNAFAQSGSGLTFKRLFMDYQTLNGGDFGAFKDYTAGFEVGYFFPIAPNLEINIPLKVGLGNRSGEVVNNSLVGLDLQGQYHLMKNPKTFSPYILAGIGGVLENKDSFNVQVPLGAGFDVKIAPQAYFNWQSEFRLSSAEDRNNFHHGIGFRYVFGGGQNETPEPMIEMPKVTDSDGDGVLDDVDKCPEIAGLEAFMGCPDTDNDGIQDGADKCPEIPGLKEMDGCPDTDGDGVSDMDDQCPNIVGSKENNGCPVTIVDTDGDGVSDDKDECPNAAGTLNGCPDTDKDGLADKDDACPYQAGLRRFGGCPDSDGDGVEDKADLCPNTAGPIDNNGCPRISTTDREVLEFAMKAVQFETGRATLKRESFSVLNQIADIMRRYEDYNLEINGHTDNTGSSSVNQTLSQQRARTCYEYLAGKGVRTNRMQYEGFGPSKPIADNNTAAGRTLNRRVEFNMRPR